MVKELFSHTDHTKEQSPEESNNISNSLPATKLDEEKELTEEATNKTTAKDGKVVKISGNGKDNTKEKNGTTSDDEDEEKSKGSDDETEDGSTDEDDRATHEEKRTNAEGEKDKEENKAAGDSDDAREDSKVDTSEESSDNEKVRDAYVSIALGDRSTQEKRRTKFMRRLNKEMDYLVERTVRVIEIVSKDPTPPKVLKKKRKKLASKNSDVKSIEPVKGGEPSTITSADSAVTILRDHLKQSHLEPLYKHVNIKGSGHMVEHTFTCTLLDLTTEGKSRRKMEAKEEAALILLKQMVRAQKTKTLNDQIPAFSDNDLKCMSSLLNEKDNFENHLQNMCYQLHEPPPLYSVAVQGTENKYFSVQCDAMGYTAIGNSKKEKIARKIAAKSILDLVAIDQEKEKEREKQREKQVKAPLELTLPRREYHNFRI